MRNQFFSPFRRKFRQLLQIGFKRGNPLVIPDHLFHGVQRQAGKLLNRSLRVQIEGFYLFDGEKIELDTVGRVLRAFIRSGTNIEDFTAQGKFTADTDPRNACVAPPYQQLSNLFGINILAFLQGTRKRFKIRRRRDRR